MTITEKLRRMLDVRDVESGYPHTLRPELHKALDAADINYWVAQGLTFWNCPDGRECVAYGYQANGKPVLAVKIVGITDPEQAVEATLGRGECHKLPAVSDTTCVVRRCGFEMEFGYWKCSNCGVECFEGAKYCMNCGAKVVGE